MGGGDASVLYFPCQIERQREIQAYVAQVKAIFSGFGAELVARGKAGGSIPGDVFRDAVAVMKCPDMQTLEAAFASDA